MVPLDAVPDGFVQPSVADFWKAPAMYRRERPSIPAPTFDHLLELSAKALEEANVIEIKADPISFKSLAPLGWAALFVAFSLSVISQLVALSSGNCNQARTQLDQGNYQEALSATALAIRCNPFSAASYFERGRALVHLLRFREAEECFNRCLTFDPDYAAALDARAALSIKLDKPEATISDTYRLMALSSVGLNTFQYGNLAVAYYKTGRYDEAIKYYDKALRLDSHSLSLQLGRTYCLSGKQQHQQALSACNALIRANGASGQVLALRGYCLERLHNLAGAARDFDLALAKEPNNPLFYSYRAALLAERNNASAALKDYMKAADLDCDNATAQHRAAKMLADSGRTSEALVYYNRLAKLPSFDRSFDQHQERAALNFSSGNYQACLIDVKRAIELEPDCDLHVTAALCQAHLGQTREARATIAEAYRLRPDCPSVALGDAGVEAVLGQKLSAVDKYSRVLLACADSREALVGRGQCYFDRGQWASAAQDFKKAVALGVDNAQVKNNLVLCENVLSRGAKIKLDLPRQTIVDLAKLNNTELFDNGCKSYQISEMPLAVIYFSELVRRQPTNLGARKNLAHSLEAAGNHCQAVAIFEPLSSADSLEVKDQTCYAHALASAGLYERSIAIVQRLHNSDPSNMTYRLELTKLFSASGQMDKALGLCRDSLALSTSGTAGPSGASGPCGTSEELRNLNNVYESLITEQLRSKKDCRASRSSSSAAETEG